MNMPGDVVRPMYLDHAASAPPREEVVESMLPWMRQWHANPHSSHFHGQRAAAAVEDALCAVGDLIGADPTEVILTSGATEANNLALQGWLTSESAQLAVSPVDHKSILEVARMLRRRGVSVTELAVDRTGHVMVDQGALAAKLGARSLLSVCHANSELGTVQRIECISKQLGEGWQLHVDASQSAGKVPIDVKRANIAFLSLSSHKMRGPGGIGALFVDVDVRGQLSPILFGGGQQRGVRPGTIPVFLAVGFGTAARLARARQQQEAASLTRAADVFLDRLKAQHVSHHVVGDPVHRLPGHVSVRIEGVDADDLLRVVSPRLSASTGAACQSGELAASHALRGIGLDEQAASEVVRISFGGDVSEERAATAAEIIAQGVARVTDR